MEEELLHLKQWKRAGERVKLYINRTKLVIRGELACGSLFSGEPEGFSLLAHDSLNRGLLELFKQGVAYSRNSTKRMCETLTDAAILSSLRWSGHQLFTPSGFIAQGKLRLSLKAPKNLSLIWGNLRMGERRCGVAIPRWRKCSEVAIWTAIPCSPSMQGQVIRGKWQSFYGCSMNQSCGTGLRA